MWCFGLPFFTSWTPSEELKQHYPPRHSDYRDSLPEDLRSVYEVYQPFVKDGHWTHGLFEMWFPKAKAVKHSVHIPCWDSFKLNPLRWRGVCMGRTCEQCYWTGLRQTRWARAVYAANLGREYVMPVVDISRRGGAYKSDIAALCWMYFAMATVLSCGIGQIFSLCGNFLFNFGALYSCHAREKIRRKYKLPPTFGLPPGIDDFLVHFLCFYCASHQEIRELAVRGVDGPGMHIMDVLPDAWDHLEGHEQTLAARQAVVADMLAHPPKLFKPRIKAAVESGPALDAATAKIVAAAKAAEAAAAAKAPEHVAIFVSEPVPAAGVATGPAGEGQGVQQAARLPSAAASATSDEEFGWLRYRVPPQQEMARGAGAVTQSFTAAQPPQPPPSPLRRAWSIAY